MTEPNKSGGMMDFFHSMPNWSKSIVFAMVTFPIALAISGMLLQVNVGNYLDKYIELQLQRQEESNGLAAKEIVAEISKRLDSVDAKLEAMDDSDIKLASRVAELENGVSNLVEWSCSAEITRDGATGNDPTWCE